jgi:hypothetical protein
MGAKDRHRPLDERAVLPAGVTITTSGEARLVGRAVVLITGLSSAAVSVSLWLQADIATAARTAARPAPACAQELYESSRFTR